ncbi:choline/glycine/proline betaine transport protein [Amycolatopsis arida]|uniref:Choline/glycine/proline betaine transport protein n=1 Tax=Amycolatopsis arida TaxID=587909 RepID=A0A1I5YNI7_9PSEU|nr:BCCT family transporter [Amycolatopsis arida]TDX90639.1 choline/glycine/proline betaine transport protein [Amycolatopsis arida]SFQ45615.1 choline/glycine/proline betaine transport protein [Amycolatopsis arida]
MATTSEPNAAAPPGPKRKWTDTIAPRVFWPSAGLIAAFVLFTVIFPGTMGDAISAIQDTIIGTFGWYYVLIVSGFVVFALWVGLGHFGDIKLGPDEEEPEFKLRSWFAMLFAAGMGIGLVFWGVAEPLNHFANPKPGVEGPPEDLAEAAMVQTFLHWGLHPWAIYVVVGLAIAYAIHRKKRPVSIRYALEPLLGRRVNGWIGDVIDIAAICGTLFGVATSLGLGVLQIASGLDYLGIVRDPGNWTAVLLIGGITTLAVVSVVTGLKRGIQFLSNFNMGLAAALLLFVLIAGPTLFLLRDLVESVGAYFQNLIRLSFDTTALQTAEGESWQASWTTFYWGWWISWAPFVGVFIARISRGRTVREFVAGVLIVPTVVTFLWFTVLGGSALFRELFGQGGLVGTDETGAPTVDTEGALFGLLDGLPGGTIAVVGAILLIALFFVTSSDSGSLVVDMLSSGGDPEPPTWSRVFWGIAEGAVAIALLLAGGLKALQVAAIVIALPFSVIMIGMCVATWKDFHAERRTTLRAQRRLQRQELTEHVSRSLIEEGLVEPNGDDRQPDPDRPAAKR